MFWPFRRKRELDAFGRPLDATVVIATEPAPDPTRAPDLMPEDVPPPVARGFDGFPLRERPQEFDPDAVQWTDTDPPMSPGMASGG